MKQLLHDNITMSLKILQLLYENNCKQTNLTNQVTAYKYVLTLVTMVSPMRNETKHTSAMKISRLLSLRSWFGNISTIAVTKPSTPTN